MTRPLATPVDPYVTLITTTVVLNPSPGTVDVEYTLTAETVLYSAQRSMTSSEPLNIVYPAPCQSLASSAYTVVVTITYDNGGQPVSTFQPVSFDC